MEPEKKSAWKERFLFWKPPFRQLPSEKFQDFGRGFSKHKRHTQKKKLSFPDTQCPFHQTPREQQALRRASRGLLPGQM